MGQLTQGLVDSKSVDQRFTTYQTTWHHIQENCNINLLKPTGHEMHHQFNIQHLYALPTLYLCVLYLSENKQ
jgi:hypothetical protein